MDIKVLKLILEELNAVGINQVRFDPNEDPTKKTTLIRGASEDKSVSIYHEVDFELTDTPIGISTVKGLLSRINLYDASKTALSVTKHTKEEFVTDINIKQGRNKGSFRCGNPKTILFPSKLPGAYLIEHPITLSNEYVTHLTKIFSSIVMTGTKEDQAVNAAIQDDGGLTFTVFDGEADTVTDVTTQDGYQGESAKGRWNIPAFQRVMKYSSSVAEDGTARFIINERQLAIFKLDLLNVAVIPSL